ncbi:MAG: AAA family ATPase [Desulfobacteraceae bacterium]|nr:AAA family ATPase [Desulfobacteraceae bacterium]
MYTSFYNLKLKPFQINPDPKFMWLGKKHRKALETLKHGMLYNKGFLLLTGDVGTGKTTLINALIQHLNKDILYASVPDSSLEFIDFLNYVSYLFGMDTNIKTKKHFVTNFRKFLSKASQKRKKVLLIIDEAQLLTYDLLEQIRLLSNIDLAKTKLLNILFVGQNEFNDTLSKFHNRTIKQRLTLNYHIEPLTVEETNEYIKYRLKVAGTKNKIFSKRAIQKIHHHSKGFPRRINIICDHCMLSGYVNGKAAVNESIVNKCARELEIPSEGKPKIIDLIVQSFFSTKNASLNLTTSIKTIGYWLTGLTLWLCTMIAAFYYIHPMIAKQRAQVVKQRAPIVKKTEPSFKINSNTLQDQLVGKVEKEQKNKDLQNKEIVPPLEAKTIIIRFKQNNNNFTDDSMVRINKFTEALQAYPDARFIVTGYTDSTGNPKYNKTLSKFRANIVKSFLMGKGIKPEKIHEQGLGGENPVERNDNQFGRKMNNRVEIEIEQP